MVGADAELPFSPMLAELVHRKLHRGEGGIAQTVQAKKRVPRRRTQESFVDGTASVHAELLMPPRVVLSAALSEQVPDRLIFFVAGTHERAVCALNHDGKRGRRKTMHMLCSTNTTVQVSGWIRQRIAIPPHAAPAAAPVCFFLQCTYRGCFRGVESWHLVVSRQGGTQSLVDLIITDSVPYSFAVRSSPAAAGCAKLVGRASCVAVLLTNNRAIAQASGCKRPFPASARLFPSSAASSLQPAAARVCFSLRCRYGSNWWQGHFSAVRSGHSCVSRHESKQSLVDQAIVDAMSQSSAVRSSLAAVWSFAMQVRDSSCTAALLTKSRALGCIRPFLASAWVFPSSAASSLQPAAAPVCHASVCGSQELVFQKDLIRLLSHAGAVSHFGCAVWPDGLFVRLSFIAAGSTAKLVPDAGCVAALLTKSRALVPVSGWIRPPVAFVHAIPPAASSLPPTAAPVCFFLQCTYRGCFKSWHLVVSRQGGPQSLLDLISQDSVPYSFAVRSSPAAAGCAKLVGRASCVAVLLANNRAIAQASGWIGPLAAHHQRKHKGIEVFIGAHSSRLFVPVPSLAVLLTNNRAIAQASGCKRPFPASARLFPSSAASSLQPAAARVCLSLRCRYGSNWWQGHFSAVQSGHSCVSRHESKKSLVDQAIVDAMSHSCAVRSSLTAVGSFAMQVRDSSCTAALLTKSRARGCNRPFLASARVFPSFAASSLQPAAARVCFSLRCRYGSNWWQGHFSAVRSGHSCVSRHESKQSLVDQAIVDAMSHSCAVRSGLTAVGSFAMQVRDSSCTAALLTTPSSLFRAGFARLSLLPRLRQSLPPVASSLPPAAAPVCFSCSAGNYRGCFRGVGSRHLVVSRQGGPQSLVDLVITDSVPYSFAVRSSPAAAGCAKLVGRASCVAVLLANNRAIAQASGWIGPLAAHHQRKHKGIEVFIGAHSGRLFVPVPLRYAHELSSKQALHSVRCMRFQELVHGAETVAWHSLWSVQASRKNHAVLRSSRCASRMWPPPVVAEPSPKKMSVPPPMPSAACMLRARGAARAAGSDFRADVGLEAAVEANCALVAPVEETLRQAQVPFILMVRNLFPLLSSQGLLQGRQVLLNLVLVGHSHGGVISHSMAQCLESAGFLVKGIVAADTLGLPRKAEMPVPLDPQALAQHRSPYHWHLSSPKVNMMAPEVSWQIGLM